MSLPMILGVVICSIGGGAGTTVLGYYTPFMIASSVLQAIGAGLITTWRPDTGHAKWIGYQVIYGCGVGFGMQQPLVAVQAVLELKDIPVGTALIMFINTLGGALFVSVGQNIFTNKLIGGIRSNVPGISPEMVVHVGATEINKIIPAQFLEPVRMAYNMALVNTWYAATAMGALTILGAVVVEWKSVKEPKTQPAAAA